MEQVKIVWDWIGNHLIAVLFILSVFIQITPIKINPWSTIFKWVRKILLEDLTNKITSIETEMRENEKDRIRWEILDFANSCHKDEKHSKDEFDHIIALNKKYQRLLKLTKDENGVFELEYEFISKLYKQNDFLREE